MSSPLLKTSSASITILMLTAFGVSSRAQQVGQPAAVARPAPVAQPGASPGPNDPDRLPDSLPDVNSIAHKFRITPIKGLSRPFSLAFLPDGNMLVTERGGSLRIVRNGVVDPRPIAGMPEVL